MNDFLFKNSDIDTMFENCFTMPPYSRVEFLSLTQRKSGFSPKIFLNLLLTRWKDYRKQVFSEFIKMGIDEFINTYGFEDSIKIWGDEPEDFEFYDYTNKDNEAILDYSCCENESALSSFTKNEQTEVAWLNEDILFLIREYIYKLYEFYTDTIKPIETSKIINMKNELFDDLHIYSNYIYNIPLESITIEKIIYLSSELFQDEFIDAKSYLFQNALLNTKESAINFVLANLNEAISTKCGNNIDFENLSDNNFNFNYTEIPGETSIKKKYSNIKYQPADFEQFKKIWLFRLIEEIKEVRNTICTILQKPIIDQKQNSDIPNKNDYDIDMYAANLGHCISTATRWDMKAIKNTTTPATPYSVFGSYFEKQREYFDNFKRALRLEFDNPINGKGFEIDIKNKFYPMIKRYYDWYDKHKSETQIFEPYNFYEWIYEWTKDTENEINKYFTSEIPITKSIDIIEKIDEYQLFSNDLNDRTEAIFKSNEDKAKKLDTYFKDIFPEYIQSTNNILTLLEDMEKSFKSSLPALTEEYNKLVSINAGFKKHIIESVEKLFTMILEIDNNRIFKEYFEAINYLETRLELENKQIASFFKTLEKRIKHLNENSKSNTSTIQNNTVLQTANVYSVNSIATEREINAFELEKYFNASFRGIGEYNINHFEKMIEDLKQSRTAKEFAEIALLIHESKHMNSRRPPHFSKWHLIFCECVGCEHVKYDPKDLRPIRKNVQSLFSYLLI